MRRRRDKPSKQRPTKHSRRDKRNFMKALAQEAEVAAGKGDMRSFLDH